MNMQNELKLNRIAGKIKIKLASFSFISLETVTSYLVN